MKTQFKTFKAEVKDQPGNFCWGDIFYIGSLMSAAEAGNKDAEKELAEMGYVFGRDY